jgi:16S rRNA pseudouridine516 synthase
MNLLRYLGNLGYGSRREVEHMLTRRRVTRRDGTRLGAKDAFTHDDVLVDGIPLDPPPGSVVLLHKPVGFVSTTNDADGRTVYELLPGRFRRRAPVMATVGRLDRDTSGLLLVTDDGQLNHRLTSPRTHLAKVYEATLASDLRGDEAALFASGTLQLDGDAEPLAPATLEVLGARHARLTLTEGRYHQARRMFAAAGNLVTALHRSALGPLTLGGLPAGEWRLLGAEEVEGLKGKRTQDLIPASTLNRTPSCTVSTLPKRDSTDRS